MGAAMRAATDFRSFPTYMMNLYLYPVAGWGALLGVLFVADRTALAIFLLYVLTLWNAALTVWWGIRTTRKVATEELTRGEVVAGVVSIGQILAVVAATPIIVFLMADPLSPSSWSTCLGVALVSAMSYYLTALVARLANRFTNAIALTVAVLALPVNTTGAVTAATMSGLYDKVLQELDMPPVLMIDKPDEE
jgi:hypothetical protein